MNRYEKLLAEDLKNPEVRKEMERLEPEFAIVRAIIDARNKAGLTQEELAFYDALTKPENIKDFYENDELIALTRELTEMLRKNRTIDWQKKETARASMRRMVKRLLKRHRYPPENYETAINTVISQCEMWTDNADIYQPEEKIVQFSSYQMHKDIGLVAEEKIPYGSGKPEE